RLVEVVTDQPSPFAATLLFRYTGAFLYDGDTPLAERRAAMLSMDPQLLAAALGTLDLRELLDPDVVAEVIAELQHTAPGRRAKTPDDLTELPRLLGPLPVSALPQRVEFPDLDAALGALGSRVTTVRIAGETHLVAVSDLAILRDALGVPIPPGYPAPPASEGRDPLTQLIARYARSHGPFTVSEVAAAFGLGVATVSLVLDREVGARRLASGRFSLGMTEPEYVDPEVLRRMRTRSLAVARRELRPVSQSAYARFLAASHQLDDRPSSNPDEVLFALQRLAGAALPASAWESHVLPARLAGYQPAHLDALLAESEVVVRVCGSAGPHDPLVALLPAGELDLLPPPAGPTSPESHTVADALSAGDGTFAAVHAVLGGTAAEAAETLWRAAEEGVIAPASMAPVRARIGSGRQMAHRAARPAPRRRARLPRATSSAVLGAAAPPIATGRWYRVMDPELSPAETALAQVSAWLERQGVVTRGGVTADGTPGGFAAAYRLLSELETAGTVLRAYVVEGLGGAQFTTREVLAQVRGFADSPDKTEWPSGIDRPTPIVLAALDPANPYGSVLPWPEHPVARPSRAAGALVVLADGLCLAHLTRGGRVLTLFADPQVKADTAFLVATALQRAIGEGRLHRLRIEEVDGQPTLVSGVYEAIRSAGGRLVPQGIVLEG
ncbi:MAG: DEAD/DEAH box helicase, partial [Acidobacteriota bacterium]|nr:DEAD/DEAH box helicase [Acidobacteriota bacterium]